MELHDKKNNPGLSGAVNKNAASGDSVPYWQWAAGGLLALLVVTQLFDIQVRVKRWNSQRDSRGVSGEAGQSEVTPADGVALPVKWGDLGKQMTEAGVIDQAAMEKIYTERGGLDDSAKQLLTGSANGALKIDERNSGFLLNLLWAFGLSNKNNILEEGPMRDPAYGGEAGNFASTGGWSLAKGEAMEHYSAHQFVRLNEQQQALVERVSQNIYRPCCGNATYFPDCNHGMAMLGLLELMAAQGVSEEEMYKAALQVNAFWFPDSYLTLAQYFRTRGVAWKDVKPQEVLGAEYSSAAGYQRVRAEVKPPQTGGGSGCAV
ncbi:MAG: hypothetical protein HY372_02520 [Candidatus Andersenbacteria bacterium]|nr:hypothetical protein [Candidatus Andersenbacteria bacterium]